jgi:hypothetical protein
MVTFLKSVTQITLDAASAAILIRSSLVYSTTISAVSGTTTGSISTTGGSTTPVCSTNGLYHAKFAKRTGSEDDSYTSNASPDIKQWMNDHFYRVLTYTPYWDDRVFFLFGIICNALLQSLLGTRMLGSILIRMPSTPMITKAKNSGYLRYSFFPAKIDHVTGFCRKFPLHSLGMWWWHLSSICSRYFQYRL